MPPTQEATTIRTVNIAVFPPFERPELELATTVFPVEAVSSAEAVRVTVDLVGAAGGPAAVSVEDVVSVLDSFVVEAASEVEVALEELVVELEVAFTVEDTLVEDSEVDTDDCIKP